MSKHSVAPNHNPFLAGWLIAGLFLACGSAHEGRPDTAELAAEPPAGGSSGGVRGFKSLDLCQLVPVPAVAEILGYAQDSATGEASMGQWASDCTYRFERGDGFSDYAMVWAYPPQLWSPEAKGESEEVSGLGDAANLTRAGAYFQVNVLLEGDLYLDTRANTAEQARALAGLAIERLAATGAGL